MWWSSGECGTPKVDSIVKEAGNYLARAWYGGITVAEFPKDKVGVFHHMISVVGMNQYVYVFPDGE